jgi:hypothetical protein
MTKKALFALSICISLLASTIVFNGSAAVGATPKSPKTFKFGPWGWDGFTVVGDRMFISNNGSGVPIASKQLSYIDKEMKLHKVNLNTKNSPSYTHSFTQVFDGKYFIGYRNSKKEGVLASLDEKDKITNYNFDKYQYKNCQPVSELGGLFYLYCGPFGGGILLSMTKSGEISKVTFPKNGLVWPEYIGTDQFLISLVSDENSKMRTFYTLDENAVLTQQFSANADGFGEHVVPTGRLKSGWILSFLDWAKTDGDWNRRCGFSFSIGTNYLLNGDGALSELGKLGANEYVGDDGDSWISDGKYFFNRLVVNSKNAVIRYDKYSVDQNGNSKFESTSKKDGCDRRNDWTVNYDLGFSWAMFSLPINDSEYRKKAALTICKELTNGKGLGQTMFNGYAMCSVGPNVIAYPYPKWEPPRLPERKLPVIKQIQSDPVSPATFWQIQSAGIGDSSWTVKCPAVLDSVKSPQLKVMGFKFDGTGQTFTRLADGTSSPSTKPDNLIGCYANLADFNSNPKDTSGWQIGSINRDASGFYWENAAGVRWGLKISGSTLITDKDNPYYDKGRQFITY